MEKKMTPMKAIRSKCLDCCCGNAREVTMCPATDCVLYPYRKGKIKGIRGEQKPLTEAERLRRSEALAKGRQKKEENRKLKLSVSY